MTGFEIPKRIVYNLRTNFASRKKISEQYYMTVGENTITIWRYSRNLFYMQAELMEMPHSFSLNILRYDSKWWGNGRLDDLEVLFLSLLTGTYDEDLSHKFYLKTYELIKKRHLNEG